MKVLLNGFHLNGRNYRDSSIDLLNKSYNHLVQHNKQYQMKMDLMVIH